jgi:hypothetical protein
MNHPIHIELIGGLRVRTSKEPAAEFPQQQTGAQGWPSILVGDMPDAGNRQKSPRQLARAFSLSDLSKPGR